MMSLTCRSEMPSGHVWIKKCFISWYLAELLQIVPCNEWIHRCYVLGGKFRLEEAEVDWEKGTCRLDFIPILQLKSTVCDGQVCNTKTTLSLNANTVDSTGKRTQHGVILESFSNLKSYACQLKPPYPHSAKQCVERGWGISIHTLVSVLQTRLSWWY